MRFEQVQRFIQAKKKIWWVRCTLTLRAFWGFLSLYIIAISKKGITLLTKRELNPQCKLDNKLGTGLTAGIG